jgi:hypothetical protein
VVSTCEMQKENRIANTGRPHVKAGKIIKCNFADF